MVFLLLWLGVYFWYQNLDNNYPHSTNPYFYNKNGVCGTKSYWECPDWFLEEKGIDLNDYFWGVFTELPEWGKEAGCIEEQLNIPCSKILN